LAQGWAAMVCCVLAASSGVTAPLRTVAAFDRAAGQTPKNVAYVRYCRLQARGGPEEVGGMRVLLAVAGACLLAATAACAPARVVVAGNPAGAVRLGGAGTSGGGWGNAELVRGLASLDKAGLPHVGGISCASPGNCVVGGFYDLSAVGYAEPTRAFVAGEMRGTWAWRGRFRVSRVSTRVRIRVLGMCLACRLALAPARCRALRPATAPSPAGIGPFLTAWPARWPVSHSSSARCGGSGARPARFLVSRP